MLLLKLAKVAAVLGGRLLDELLFLVRAALGGRRVTTDGVLLATLDFDDLHLEDKDIAAAVLADLKAKKIRTVKGAEAVGFDVPERPRPVVVKLQAPGGGPVKGSVQELRVDAYLAAVGRKPNTDNLA